MHEQKCEKCGKTFVEFGSLRKHRKSCLYRCKICKISFINQELLDNHNNEMHEMKCEICDKIFIDAGFLKKHMNSFHKEKKIHKCGKCGKVFTTTKNLKRHTKNTVHYDCNLCSESFISEKKRKCHFTLAHRKNNRKNGKIKNEVLKSEYQCYFCDMNYEILSDLKLHISNIHKIKM